MQTYLFTAATTRVLFVVTLFFGVTSGLFVPFTASAQYILTTNTAVQNNLEALLPKCTLGANPVLVYSPNTTTLSWTTAQADSVQISDVGTVASTGQYTVQNVFGTRNFTLTANNTYGPRTCSVTVFGQNSGATNGTTTYTNQQYTNPYYTNPIYQNVQPVQPNVQHYVNQAQQQPQYYAQQPTYGYASPVTYGAGSHYEQTYSGVHRSVPLSRLPYTGAEDVFYTIFSVVAALTSAYGFRRSLA
jgi:hypothetical protein